jgi:hypothetical protein
MDNLAQWLGEQLDEDERIARAASHVLRDGAHWSLDEWHGREQPHSLIAQGTTEQPVALGHFTADPVPTEQALHIARHDPARVLRDVHSKRRIIELHSVVHREIGWLKDGQEEHDEIPVCSLCVPRHSHYQQREDVPQGSCLMVRLLALPYADRPGYREDWAPPP